MQKCAVCGKPVKSEHPNAQVSHMACAMEECKEVRERQQAKGHKPYKKWKKK